MSELPTKEGHPAQSDPPEAIEIAASAAPAPDEQTEVKAEKPDNRSDSPKENAPVGENPVEAINKPTTPIKNIEYKRSFWHYLMWGLFSVYVLFSLANAGEYWLFHHQGWNGARRSIQGINYIKYGYLKTGLKPLDNLGYLVKENGEPKEDRVYWHHPPAPNIYLSVVYSIFGIGEPQARLSFALLSILVFLMLWRVFRRAGGERAAFLALFGYSFMPIMATYLGFVNFETLIFFCMASVLYGWDRWRETKKRRYFVMACAGVFIGTFTDYPILPFFFYVYLLMIGQLWVARKESNGSWWSKYWPSVIFPTVVLVSFLLMVLLLASWKDSSTAFLNLAKGRAKMGNNAFMRIMDKWNWYIDFFTPYVYFGVGFYILDLLPRIVTKKLRLLDAYFFIYLATALTYLAPLKQALVHHEYGSLYFAMPLAIAFGLGLNSLTRLLSRGRPLLANALLLAFLIPLVLFAVPRIHSKHCSPSYEFVVPIYEKNTDYAYNYQIPHAMAAKLGNEIAKPEEPVIVSYIDMRPPIRYYLDRVFQEGSNKEDLQRLLGQRRFASHVSNTARVDHDILIKKLLTKKHLKFRRFAAIDLHGDRLENTEVRVLDKKERSDFTRYFTSHTQSGMDLITDHWRSADYAFKLDDHKSGRYHLKKTKEDKRVIDPLFKDIAKYNQLVSQHKRVDLKKVTRYLDVPKKPQVFSDDIRLIGYRLMTEPDGKQLLTCIFRLDKPVRRNYNMTWHAISEANVKRLREKMGTTKSAYPFEVPVSLWKSMWLYVAETRLDIPYERYTLKLGLDASGSEHLFDSSTKKDTASVFCPTVTDSSAAQSLFESFQSDPNRYLDADAWKKHDIDLPKWAKQIRFENEYEILACIVMKNRQKKDWTAKMIVKTIKPKPGEMIWQAIPAGAKKKQQWKSKVTFPDRNMKMRRDQLEIIEFDIPKQHDTKRTKLAVQVYTVSGKTMMNKPLVTGNMGIRFPIHWLVKTDALRWFSLK